MKRNTKAPLSAAALSRIFGARLIRASGYDRSAIMKYARRWAQQQGVAFGAAQKRAWDVARGQMEKARAYDAARLPVVWPQEQAAAEKRARAAGCRAMAEAIGWGALA